MGGGMLRAHRPALLSAHRRRAWRDGGADDGDDGGFGRGDLERLAARLDEVWAGVGCPPADFVSGRAHTRHDVGAFEANRLLWAFDLLAMEPVYELDYVYARDYYGGEPFIYARRTAEAPLASLSDYFSRFSLTLPEMLLGFEPFAKMVAPLAAHMSFADCPLG